MDSANTILLKVKEKPVIYLGRPSLELFRAFISGYLICMDNLNRNSSFEFYPGFQEFIVKKYEIKISTHWSDIIRFVSSSDEQAFYKFFDLLDEFKQTL